MPKGIKFLRPSSAILPLMKRFIAPAKKIESAPDEKNTGHASAFFLYEYENFDDKNKP